MGGLCLGAAGLAYGLKPRRKLTLLGRQKMEAIIPKSFPGWSAAAAEGLVKPKLEGLAASLYNEVVQRSYISETLRAEIMLLVAYGGTQGDVVQLHRPEACYPALGFEIDSKKSAKVHLPGGASLPAVQIVASAGDRHENLVYWTRLGEDLPLNSTEQRKILLKDAMAGFIPDGVLVRASVVDNDEKRGFETLNAFLPALMTAVKAANRPALIGTAPAKAMAAAGV
ncbi:MAG TPA: EpsI family protein [Phenylobacterium sp.]|nr:EpsI family protein [Phenylobacterium sp.]